MTIELITAESLDWMRQQPDGRFDLVLGSPPYVDARLYLEAGQDLGVSRGCVKWVEWMLDITTEAHRICRGPVLWVCAGVTRQRNYWPACEGLAWEWWKRGGDCQLYRPCVFHRVGIPGSGGKDWFRADWEFVLCFKHAGQLPWADNTACGHPPKWAPGGEMSYRNSAGTRRNQWGAKTNGSASRNAAGELVLRPRPSHVVTTAKQRFEHAADGQVKGGHARDIPRPRKVQTRRKANGERPGARGRDGMHNQEQDYQEPVLANPGNAVEHTYTATEVAEILQAESDWLHCKVGGGVMGDRLAHSNEAPYPEALCEFFIRSLCPPGGIVLDPFSGSGTTVAVARKLGRKAVGVDLRESQTAIARQRVGRVQKVLI